MITYPLDIGPLQTRIIEDGGGPRTVVFLHGVGARADRWTPMAARVAASGFHAVALDFPGHGFASKGPAPDYSVPGYAAFVRSALDALGLRRAAIVGTSMGGHVAASIALNQPKRINGLVLVGAVGLTPLPEATGLIGAGLLRRSRSDIAAKLRRVLSNHALVTEALIDEEWRINNSAGADAAFQALSRYWLTQLNADVVGPRLRQSKDAPPIRLIWGAEDQAVTPAAGQAAADLLTGGEMHLIPRSAHAPYLDAPEAFASLLLPFLEELCWREEA